MKTLKINYGIFAVTATNTDHAVGSGFGPTWVYRVNARHYGKDCEPVPARAGALQFDPLVSAWFTKDQDAADAVAEAVMQGKDDYVMFRQPEVHWMRSFKFMEDMLVSRELTVADDGNI